MKFQIGLCICYLLFVCMADYNKITMGPFDAVIHRIEECSDVGKGRVRFSSKLRRISRTTISLDMNASSTIEIDDSFSSLAHFAQFTNGGWKENFFVKEFSHICSTVINLAPDVLGKVAKAAGVPNEPKCPLPPSNFTIKNLKLDFEFKNIVPIFIYSKYRGDVILKKKGTVYGCMRIHIDIVPQRRYGGTKKKG